MLERYQLIRKQTLEICKNLEIEDYVIQPVDFVSPPKWHLAHTTWFFETLVLQRFERTYKVYHESYSFIFNSYYESLGPRVGREFRGTLSRPTVKEVLAYRSYVDECMQELINKGINQELKDLIELGLQHEQQHQELLVYDIKYILFSNPLKPAYFPSVPPEVINNSKTDPMKFREFKGGLYEIGFRGKTFAWDNESPAHHVYLNDFKVANRLITNGEFLEFISDDGYKKFNFWLDDGWHWKNQKEIEAPLYWMQRDGEWYEFSLYGLLKLNLSAPVCHISFYEANAFAAWKDKRLLSEYEWEVMAHGSLNKIKAGNFLDKSLCHPVSTSFSGELEQIFGDVWEWTASAYQPYPGYKSYPGPLGEYNGKFMINQMVLRGGSCATPANHIRITYRNFFQPAHRWMVSGIRLGE